MKLYNTKHRVLCFPFCICNTISFILIIKLISILLVYSDLFNPLLMCDWVVSTKNHMYGKQYVNVCWCWLFSYHLSSKSTFYTRHCGALQRDVLFSAPFWLHPKRAMGRLEQVGSVGVRWDGQRVVALLALAVPVSATQQWPSLQQQELVQFPTAPSQESAWFTTPRSVLRNSPRNAPPPQDFPTH